MIPPELELRAITRTFGATIANRSVNLSVDKGEIHAVVGENGAGKSTLLRIAAGLLSADSGEIRVRGEFLTRPTPARAIARGIGMVQQHFQLLPPFTVAENVVLGAEPRRGLLFDRARAESQVAEIAEKFSLSVDVAKKVEELSVGERQRVEILKALYRKAELLILDEPTAVLAPVEVDDLFEVLRMLVSRGHTVVFVTHKLREVMAVSDRVTVMRCGEVVTTTSTRDTSIPKLAEMMVGDAQAEKVVSSESTAEPVQGKSIARAATPTAGAGSRPSKTQAESSSALWVEGLGVLDPQGVPVVRDMKLHVRPGEIVGVAGVQGNGQTELVEAIAGLMDYSGTVKLAGRSLEGLDPGARLEAGLAHIPEDRRERGLVADFSVADNLILGAQRRYSRGGSLQKRRILGNALDAISSFDIRPPIAAAAAGALSGGNQQKIVVARELGRKPKLLLAAQPTRGVDIGAMATIHAGLLEAKAAEAGILLVSADLTELLELSDRILVMYRGEIVGEMPRAEATEAKLGALMVGGRVEG